MGDAMDSFGKSYSDRKAPFPLPREGGLTSGSMPMVAAIDASHSSFSYRTPPAQELVLQASDATARRTTSQGSRGQYGRSEAGSASRSGVAQPSFRNFLDAWNQSGR